jgi:hypothetical protein
MRSKLLLTGALIAVLTATPGCGASTTTSTGSGPLMALADKVDVARMMDVVEYLAGEELKGRPTGSPESAEVESYLEERLRAAGLEPVDQLGLEGYRQEFQVPPERCFLENPPPPGQPVTGVNVLGKIPGESASEMIVITANYDGPGRDSKTGAVYPGADYNASGASAVLELATVLSSQGEVPGKTLVFALLGGEECGNYGSQALAESLEAGGFRQSARIINLEGLGAGDGDYMDIWDLNYRKNRPTVETVDKAAGLLGVVLELGGADPGTSAATFFLYHFPAVTCDWSWFDRSEHPDFHQPSDTPDKINRGGLRKATQVVGVAAWTLAE